MLKKFDIKRLVAGCDEAGRGALAGPVVASAVILPYKFHNILINDSKKISKKQREELEPIIKKEATAWSIGISSEKEIDQINILNASILAMHRAIKNLNIKPELLLIDGNRFKKYQETPHKCIIKGDEKYLSIAAASIIAKVHRDHIMSKIHEIEGNYMWNKNKGYPTKEHKIRIRQFGISKYHRKSFQLVENNIKL
tara:strand:- start:1853 stop:2443 length:591 start_codon:yes stop_codon:yes gene_type:complete